MKNKVESLYLTYVNDFLTVDRFAEYYGFERWYAARLINIGRRLNHRKTKAV